MAITYISTSTVDAGTSASSSASVTIPSGAAYAFVCGTFWLSGAVEIGTVTIDGQSTTFGIDQARNGDNAGGFMGRCTGFSTGAGKTVAWTWTGSNPGEGGRIYILWFSSTKDDAFVDTDFDANTIGARVNSFQVTATDATQAYVVLAERFDTDTNAPTIVPDDAPDTTLASDITNDLYRDQRVQIRVYQYNTATLRTFEMDNEWYSTMMTAIIEEGTGGGGGGSTVGNPTSMQTLLLKGLTG